MDFHRTPDVVYGPASREQDFLRQKTIGDLSSIAIHETAETIGVQEPGCVANISIDVFPWLVGATRDEQRGLMTLGKAPHVGYVDGMTDRLHKIQEKSSFVSADQLERVIPSVLEMLAADHEGLGSLTPVHGLDDIYSGLLPFCIKSKRPNASRTYLGIMTTNTVKYERLKSKLEANDIEICVVLLARCDKKHQKQTLTILNGSDVDSSRFIS